MLQILTFTHMPMALVTDPTWVFFVVLMIILFSPILLRRLRTPHIIGLILAGVMIGQHGFNIIERTGVLKSSVRWEYTSSCSWPHWR